MGQRNERFKQLEKLIRENSLDGKNYEYLGDYYLEENKEKAYLCYENALFLGSVDEEAVKRKLEKLEQEEVNQHKVSIVILSYNCKDMMIECINSIRKNNPSESYELVVVDNASADGIVEWLKEQRDIVLQCNEENVGFPKGCNQGIRLSEKNNDIMLLNNDTIVTENALFWLRMALCEPMMGATGSICNMAEKLSSQGTGKETRGVEEQLQQAMYNNILLENPYEKGIFLLGYALLLKRSALEEVGYLDERFSPGNFEDADICLRLIFAGYELAMCYNSFIFHYGSTSFNKEREQYLEIYRRNYCLYREKYGFDVSYYSRQRWELLEEFPKNRNQKFRVLDVGCGCGNTLCRIRALYPKAEVVGVEKNQKAVEIAEKVIPAYCVDIEFQEMPFEKQSFDFILMGNVLEQLKNPLDVLMKIKQYLKTGGKIIASVYNSGYVKNICALLRGRITYIGQYGLWDQNNIRYFTGNSLVELVKKSGFQVQDIKGRGMALSPEESQLMEITQNMQTGIENAMLRTENYIVVAEKKD